MDRVVKCIRWLNFVRRVFFQSILACIQILLHDLYTDLWTDSYLSKSNYLIIIFKSKRKKNLIHFNKAHKGDFQKPSSTFEKISNQKLDDIKIFKPSLPNMYCLCCIHAVIISVAILGIDNHKNIITVAYFCPKMQNNHYAS